MVYWKWGISLWCSGWEIFWVYPISFVRTFYLFRFSKTVEHTLFCWYRCYISCIFVSSHTQLFLILTTLDGSSTHFCQIIDQRMCVRNNFLSLTSYSLESILVPQLSTYGEQPVCNDNNWLNWCTIVLSHAFQRWATDYHCGLGNRLDIDSQYTERRY